MTVRDTDPGFRSFRKRLARMEAASLDVGIFNPVIAEYAARNEKTRPFFSTALRVNDAKYRQMIDRGATRILDGATTPAVILARLGIEVRNDVIDSILEGDWKENAESTKARKGSSRPLVDTGAMQRALTHRVRTSGGGR